MDRVLSRNDALRLDLPPLDRRPVLAVVQKYLIPLREEIEWGYHMPYIVTGMLNEHPRSAMKFMAEPERGSFVAFYEQMMDATQVD